MPRDMPIFDHLDDGTFRFMLMGTIVKVALVFYLIKIGEVFGEALFRDAVQTK